MTTHSIEDIVRRSNRNLLLTNAALIVVVFAVAALSSRYLLNFVTGPYDIPRDDVLNLTEPGTLQRYWVTIQGDETIDTGVQEVTTRTYAGAPIGESVTASYVALLLDDRMLLVRVRTAYTVTDTLFSGALVAMPADEQREIIDEIVEEVPDLEGVFLPVMLDTEPFRAMGFIGLAIGIPVLLIGLFNVFRALRRSLNPGAHPAMQALKAYGPAQSVAALLDAEASGPGVTRAGQATVTPNWLIKTTPLSLDVVRLDDLAWIYKKVTTQRVYFIPTGKTFAAILRGQKGKLVEVAGKEDEVTRVLQAVAHRVPWVFAGYSAEMDKAWRSDQAGVLQAVNERRQRAKALEAQ